MNEPPLPELPSSTVVLDDDLPAPPPSHRFALGNKLVALGLALGLVSLVLVVTAPSRPGQRIVSIVRGAAPRGADAAPTTSRAAPPLPPTTTEVPLLTGDQTLVPRALDHVPRIALFGDSLGLEADPHLAKMLHDGGEGYRFDGWGGTATCDYLSAMDRTASDFDPDVVILLFTGNALTPCITERSGGGRGIVAATPGALDLFAFADAYAVDTIAAIETFDAHTDIVLVGVPLTRNGPAVEALLLDEVYRDIAGERPNVHYLSLDRYLTPGHRYADQLPCLLMEPCTPGEAVQVRHPDGGHLCPAAPTFCFGGLRMAVMIGDAVRQLVVEPGNVHSDAIESATQADHQG